MARRAPVQALHCLVVSRKIGTCPSRNRTARFGSSWSTITTSFGRALPPSSNASRATRWSPRPAPRPRRSPQPAGHVPDLVILDVSLPDGSGIETCREIKARNPETKVVILTGSADEDTVLTAVVAGANGYLLKSSGVREVMHAIDVVAAGGSLLDPVATDRMVRRIRRLGEGTEADPLVGLAARERRILELISAGQTNKEIAAEIKLVREDGQALGQRDPVQAQSRTTGPGRGPVRRATTTGLIRARASRPGSPGPTARSAPRGARSNGRGASVATPRGPAGAIRRRPRNAGRDRRPEGAPARGPRPSRALLAARG